MADNYEPVRATLPKTMPPITREEAQRAADRLWRHFTKESKRRRVRRCWISRSSTVGHWRGWGRLVHDVSHRIFSHVYPDRRPHDPLHAHYEHEVAKYVVEHGWLDGKLKPAPRPKRPKPSASDKLAAVEVSIKRWESKAKRAATALKKLRRRRSALARHVAA